MTRFPQNASRVLIKRKIEDKEMHEDFAQSNVGLTQCSDEAYVNRFARKRQASSMAERRHQKIKD